MERQEAFTKVVNIIKPYARDEAALKSVNDGTNILKDLKVNSARLVDIIIAFEDEFKVTIDDSSAEKARTVGEVVTLILQKTSGSA